MALDLPLWQPPGADTHVRPWVARVTGPSARYLIGRRFLQPVSCNPGGQWTFRIEDPGLYVAADRPSQENEVIFSILCGENTAVFAAGPPVYEEYPESALAGLLQVDEFVLEPDAQPQTSALRRLVPVLTFRGPDFDYFCRVVEQKVVGLVRATPPEQGVREAYEHPWTLMSSIHAQALVFVLHEQVGRRSRGPRFEFGEPWVYTGARAARTAVLFPFYGRYSRERLAGRIGHLARRWQARVNETLLRSRYFYQRRVQRCVNCRPSLIDVTRPQTFRCNVPSFCPFCYSLVVINRWVQLSRALQTRGIARNPHRQIVFHSRRTPGLVLEPGIRLEQLARIRVELLEDMRRRIKKLNPAGALCWFMLVPGADEQINIRVNEIFLFSQRKGVKDKLARLKSAAAWKTEVFTSADRRPLLRAFVALSYYPKQFFTADPQLTADVVTCLQGGRTSVVTGICRQVGRATPAAPQGDQPAHANDSTTT